MAGLVRTNLGRVRTNFTRVFFRRCSILTLELLNFISEIQSSSSHDWQVFPSWRQIKARHGIHRHPIHRNGYLIFLRWKKEKVLLAYEKSTQLVAAFCSNCFNINESECLLHENLWTNQWRMPKAWLNFDRNVAYIHVTLLTSTCFNPTVRPKRCLRNTDIVRHPKLPWLHSNNPGLLKYLLIRWSQNHKSLIHSM